MLNAAQPSDRALLSTRESKHRWPRALSPGKVERRSFLKALGAAGAALSAGALEGTAAKAKENGSISKGDAAIFASSPPQKSSKPTSGCNTTNSQVFRTGKSRAWPAS